MRWWCSSWLPDFSLAHSQTWWSPSLPFLPRSKQFDTREHVQLARFLICAFTVARAAAAAARVRLLPLPCLPLLADQGAGDSRCPGHVPPGEVKQGCASRSKGRGFADKAVGVCGVRGGGSTPPTAQFASHTGRCRLADIHDLKKRPESSISAPGCLMEVVKQILKSANE